MRAERLTEGAAQRVEDGQLEGTAGAIALTLPVVARNLRQLQIIAQVNCLFERRAGRQNLRNIGPPKESPARFDGFAGDIFTRNALAVARGAVVQHAADDQVFGLLALVRGMANPPAQRDVDVVGG